MATVVQPLQEIGLNGPIQPMPALTSEQLHALRTDIAERGVLVPITVDQHGRVLDGNNRAAIASELGVECPRIIVEVADDAAAIDLALTLNCARRHLTREQVREIVVSEIARRPNDSDRAIAARVGCSPTTVGSVRRRGSEVSNLDTSDRAEAEQRAAELDEALSRIRVVVCALLGDALMDGVSVGECLGALTMARLRYEQRQTDGAVAEVFRVAVFDYIAQVASWPEFHQQCPPRPSAELAPGEREQILEGIRSVGEVVG